jgi:hypothetical protein
MQRAQKNKSRGSSKHFLESVNSIVARSIVLIAFAFAGLEVMIFDDVDLRTSLSCSRGAGGALRRRWRNLILPLCA